MEFLFSSYATLETVLSVLSDDTAIAIYDEDPDIISPLRYTSVYSLKADKGFLWDFGKYRTAFSALRTNSDGSKTIAIKLGKPRQRFKWIPLEDGNYQCPFCKHIANAEYPYCICKSKMINNQIPKYEE